MIDCQSLFALENFVGRLVAGDVVQMPDSLLLFIYWFDSIGNFWESLVFWDGLLFACWFFWTREEYESGFWLLFGLFCRKLLVVVVCFNLWIGLFSRLIRWLTHQ